MRTVKKRSLFAGLSIVITVGGFFDIKALLTTIDARHKSADGDTPDDAGKTG